MKKIAQELRQKAVKELQKEADQMRSEMAKLSLEFKTNMPKDTNTIVKKRKRLAVLLTILGEKQETEGEQKA